MRSAKCKSSSRKDCGKALPETPHRTWLNGGIWLGRPKVHLAGKYHKHEFTEGKFIKDYQEERQGLWYLEL